MLYIWLNQLKRYDVLRYLISILIALLLIGCKSQSEHTFTLTFDFPGNPHDTVQIYYIDPLDFTHRDIGISVLDPAGAGRFEVHTEENTFIVLDLDQNIRHVLLSPFGELNVSGSKEDPSYTAFIGDGAEANTYLMDLAEIFSRYSTWNGMDFYVLDSLDFLQRKEQLENEIADLRSGLSAEVRNSETVLKLLDQQAEFRIIAEALNNELVKQRQLPLDTRYLLENPSGLSSRSSSYRIALALFYHSRIFNEIMSSFDPEKRDSVSVIYPELAYDQVLSLECSSQLKELLIAKLLHDSFMISSFSSVLQDTYERWKTEYPDSEYLPSVDQKYQAILVLEPGTDAPEIRGITPDGEEFYLSDLLGKVVYIKVWATWCSPCIRSFPDLDTLATVFAEEDLAILCISYERDQEAWRTFLEENEVAGIHISVEPESFRENYLFASIPRYFLIDAEGRIVDAKAPTPDKQELLDLINDLI